MPTPTPAPAPGLRPRPSSRALLPYRARTPARLVSLLVTALLTAGLGVGGATAATATTAAPRIPVPTTTAPEAPSRYQGQVSCDPTEKPGAAALRDLLRATYGKANAGGTVRTCSQGGTSEHKEGRAYDWMLDAADPADKALADAFIAWLVGPDSSGVAGGNAHRLGIQYLIWNRQTWQAWTGAWKPYTGASPHTDHVHLSLSWDGAFKRTSWWTGMAVTRADHGPCQVYIGQLAPAWSSPNYSTCPRAVPLPAGDLYAVVTGGASGTVEIHADSRSSSYRQRMLSTATGLPTQPSDQWRYFLGKAHGGQKPDLLAVRTAGTSSGKVEVSVYSASSDYKTRTSHTVTPVTAFTPDQRWQVDVAADASGRPDLVFFDLAGASGTVEAHALSAASGYASFNLHTATALATGYDPRHVKLFMDDARNLWLVIHDGRTGSGGLELHILSTASRYKTFTLHRALPAELGPLTKWGFATGDYTGDSRHDLYLLKVDQTGSGRTEVHVLTAASSFRTFALHRATSLPMLRYPTWQVTIG